MFYFIFTKFSNLFVVSDNFISNIFALVTGRYKKLMASWGRGQYLIYSWGNKKKTSNWNNIFGTSLGPGCRDFATERISVSREMAGAEAGYEHCLLLLSLLGSIKQCWADGLTSLTSNLENNLGNSNLSQRLRLVLNNLWARPEVKVRQWRHRIGHRGSWLMP